MRQVLKSKNFCTSEQFQYVYDHIEEFCTRSEVEQAVDAALTEMAAVLRGKAWGIGWSGGKDSEVLNFLARQVGVTQGVYGSGPALEFPAFNAWAAQHKPAYVEEIAYPYDVHWLVQNQALLFCKETHQFFTAHVTRAAQHAFFERYRPDLMLYGRRTLDGNAIGHSGPYELLPTGRGHNQYFPMRHWNHELTLAVLRYAQLPLAPTYAWPDGWRNTSTFWCARKDWAESYAIDPSVVLLAAGYIPSAREFWNGLKTQ